MASKSQRQKGHDGVPSRLDVAIQLLSGAKDACGAAPAQIVLGSVYDLLAAIKVHPPPVLRRRAPNSQSPRTTWATNKPLSISDCSVLKCVEPLTEG
jgi:hypothetical protein